MDPTRQKAFASLGLALLAAVLAFLYLRHREQLLLLRGTEVQVLVAAKYLPAYTRLEPEHLAYHLIPAEFVPKGAVTDPKDILGWMTLVPFNYKEPVLFNKVALADQALAAAVPEGTRAFTVPVDAVTGVAGLIRPGDLVDVLFLTQGEKARGRDMASTLFQAVKVLAVGSRFSQGAEKDETPSPSVCLALTPKECEIAMFALSRGLIQLTLRPSGDSRTVSLKSVGLEDVLGRIESQAAAEPGRKVEIIRGSEKEDFVIQKR